MKTREELLQNLHIVINENIYNKKLISELAKKFEEKGLSYGRPNQIFANYSPLESLSLVELIILTRELYNFLKQERIKPGDYFSDKELLEIQNYKKPKNEIKKDLILKNVVQIDDLQWICPFWSLEEIYEAHNNAQLSYNFNTQREATYKTTQTGEVIITATLNKESVKDISEEMYNNKFTPNMITLNVRLIDGKKPNIKYDKSARKLILTPDYDFNSPNTTFIDTTDGWHRINGGLWAVDKAKETQKQLKGGLVVLITCFTEEEAKKYIAREAKRNDMSKEYTDALSDDDYNKIARMINDYGNSSNNILNNNVASTYNEVDYVGKYTTLEVIREALKQTDIDAKDMLDVKIALPKITEIITTLVNYIVKYKFDNDIEKVKKETVWLKPNVFVGYMAIANELKNDKEYINKIIKISDILFDKTNKELNELGLASKQLKQKKIYEYFKNIISEVD